jgi:hypothetical protein
MARGCDTGLPKEGEPVGRGEDLTQFSATRIEEMDK